MTSFPDRAGLRLLVGRGIALAMLISPCVSADRIALAQSELAPGAVGLVADSGGQPVLLRETPSFDGAVLASYPEGTPADIVEGPLYGEDGTAWLGVAIGGVTGYMVAGYLIDSRQDVAAAPVDDTTAVTPTEELAADAAPAESLPAPAASSGDGAASLVATADLNLRAGPSYDDMVLAIIPAGAALQTTGEWADGFAGVLYDGQYGWVDGSWLGEAAPAAPEAVLLQVAAPADDAALVSNLTAPAGETAQAVDVANLRLGPSTEDEILRVLPAGATVTITGVSSDGWTPVWYNGTWGFISVDLLSADSSDSVSLAQEAAPAETLETAETGSGEMLATTLDDVNLRAAPDATAEIVATIPAGATLTPLAGPDAGFYQVDFQGQIGWVAAEYLQVSTAYLQKGDRNGGKVEDSEPADNARENSGGIIWPVSGGAWQIMQGYNGSSHQNGDGLWQYYYSLDLVREDGETAGQPIISPVNGVVRWTDPSSGGISIDMGDGHAVALFHVTFDGSLEAGTKVSQGEHLGTISGAGGPGYAGTPHVHFTLWTSDDDGNWDRHAVPFTGKYSISGMSFPDIGGSSQYAGTEFHP